MKTAFAVILSLLLFAACGDKPEPVSTTPELQGWNILTSNDSLAVRAIERAADYNINHLQLSHSIVMDLKDVKDASTADKVNHLTSLAHENGIDEVTIWDHALYQLDYYPDEYKTGPSGTINLDNPAFWGWIKNDYRSMLQLVPEVDGIILTFIETGAHVEDQHSKRLATEEEKLAAMVDTLASVIIDEFNMSLYIRTFIYTRAELGSLLKAIELVKHPEVRVMTKETPHDFFLTHPASSFVKDIDAPVLIEFDCAHEYNGQGIIASILPEVHLKRWEFYSNLPNVIGYVARTDRKNTTSIIGNPAEINLYALHKAAESSEPVNTDEMYEEFIAENYGGQCVEFLKPAFKMAEDIILSTLYTLGLPLNSHSRLDIENDSAFQRHVSGKWLDNMNIQINRGIDTTLHYWKDIVNHLAPPWYKGEAAHQLAVESRWVLEKNWLTTNDEMNEDYLRLVIAEKEFGVERTNEVLSLVRKAEECASDRVLYDTTLHVFERTLLTARLYKAAAGAYFGYRVYANGPEHRNDFVLNTIEQSVEDLRKVILEMLDYPHTGPEGQFVWRNDAYRAMRLYLEFVDMNGDYTRQYTRDTFERFDYFGPSKEEIAELKEHFLNFTSQK